MTNTPNRKPLHEQPFDATLLKKSRIYRKSRSLYLSYGGVFRTATLSSARSLSSAELIQNRIEYSPIASELEWSCSDRLQKKDQKHFQQVRAFVTNVFHEQNHRILWEHFKEAKVFCPSSRDSAYRFLNLAESLVVVLDMALGDELGFKVAAPLYRKNVVYNPGSRFMTQSKLGKRQYRNALQVALHATNLRLQGLHPEDVPIEVRAAFRFLDQKLVDQTIERAMLLDPLFVELTNPIWQKKHVNKVMDAFCPGFGQNALELPKKDPRNYFEAYLIAEKWFQKFGL